MKILMCPPTHYGVNYSINPWMRPHENAVERSLAQQQWDDLKALISKFAEVVLMDPVPGLPDIVFTANAGFVHPLYRKVFLSNFKHPERQPERDHYKKWFVDNNFHILEIAPSRWFEGAGDCLFAGRHLRDFYPDSLYIVCGHGFRSNLSAFQESVWKEHITYSKFAYLKLMNPYFYHLDTCFCPLKDDFALIWPGAFEKNAEYLLTQDAHLVLLKVPEEDAQKFACNAVCIKNDVILPAGCPGTKKLLESAGFTAHETDMSEFIKAGGACKCLTLVVEDER